MQLPDYKRRAAVRLRRGGLRRELRFRLAAVCEHVRAELMLQYWHRVWYRRYSKIKNLWSRWENVQRRRAFWAGEHAQILHLHSRLERISGKYSVLPRHQLWPGDTLPRQITGALCPCVHRERANLSYRFSMPIKYFKSNSRLKSAERERGMQVRECDVGRWRRNHRWREMREMRVRNSTVCFLYEAK